MGRLSLFWVDFAIVCMLIVAAFVLYGPSLAYPFVWYDADDLLRAIKYSTADLFGGVASYQYYRPLIFTIWKVILGVWGPASAPMIHASLIGAHTMSGVLLFATARDLTRQRWLAGAAAFLFVCYPFNYQAVTWAIAHQPPSMVSVMGAILIYVRARLKSAGWPYHIAALACLVGAMLLHESAFVAAGLVLLVEAYLVLTRRVARVSPWPLAYLAVTLIVFAVYSSAAKSNPDVDTFQPLTGLYLLQGLVYPVAMALARMCTSTGCDSAPWLLLAAGLALIVLCVAWRRNRTMLVGLVGLLWFVLGVAPIWAGRDYIYVEYAPRLLYLASAGAALALAAILGADTNGWRRAAQVGIVAVILAQSAQFVMARQSLHERAFRLLEQENRAMFAPRQRTALFVNTVELFSFKEREFPLGWFGVLVSPWHNRLVETPNLRADRAEWVIDPAQAAGTSSRSQLALEYHGRIVSPEQFREALTGVGDVYRVEALTPNDGALHLFKVAEIDRASDLPGTYVAEWLNAVRLVSASVETEAGIPVLSLEWIVAGAIDPNQTVFVHVRDASGRIVAQADGDLIGGLAPFGLWSPGDVIRERRPLILPADLPAGDYIVAVGLYDRGSSQRALPVSTGHVAIDDLAVIASHITHPIPEEPVP